MVLCPACSGMIRDFYGPEAPDSAFLTSVVSSARCLECPFCALLEDCFRDAIVHFKKQGWLETFKLRFVRVKDASGSISELIAYTFRNRPDGGPYSKTYGSPGPHYFQHFQLAADRGSYAHTSRALPTGCPCTSRGYTGNPNFQNIGKWLNKCVAEHEGCKMNLIGTKTITALDQLLPSRCVDVTEDNPILRQTKGEVGSYIALSHRWMDATKACQTTTLNYTERTTRGFDPLPKVFYDTIEVARKLDIRYVWIDSLCIIQEGDEGRDWEIEALKMSDYYQGATLTIAAMDCGAGRGLFPEWGSPGETPLVELPFHPNPGPSSRSVGHFYIFPIPQDRVYQDRVFHNYRDAVSNSELLTRAWVFQEWVLSRRILCATAFGPLMQCRFGDVYDDRLKDIDSSRRLKEAPPELMLKRSISFNMSSLLKAWQLWYDLVSVYSGTRPTKTIDRVVAIAGVASEILEAIKYVLTTQVDIAKAKKLPQWYLDMRPRMSLAQWDSKHIKFSCDYLSGLWLWDIYHGLLWEQNCLPGSCGSRVTGFPTWSWASLMTSVGWVPEKHKMSLLCEVIRLCTTNNQEYEVGSRYLHFTNDTASNQQFSLGIPAVKIVIKCRLQPIMCNKKFARTVDRDIVASATGYSSKLPRDHWRRACSPMDPIKTIGWASFDHPEFQDDAAFYEGHVIHALHVFQVHNIYVGYGLGSFNPHSNAFWALLVRSVGKSFERVGVGRLFGKDIEKGFSLAVERLVDLI